MPIDDARVPPFDGRSAPTRCPAIDPHVKARRQVLTLLAASAAAATLGGPSRAQAAEPRRAAAAQDLKEPWSSVEFTVRDGDEDVPGILIALPVGEVYGVSMLCTHGGCRLQYKTNFREINDTYDVNLSTPALVCPCHLSVFDLARGGAVATGPAPRPPWRFELAVQGGEVLVGKVERP